MQLTATYPGLERYGGRYLRDCRLRPSSPESNDPEVAQRLWQLTGSWTGVAAPSPGRSNAG